MLDQNYPNPFNPGTTIRYELPQTSRVDLRVYDLLGRVIVTLIDGVEQAGSHEIRWTGKDSKGMPVASGAYYYQLRDQSSIVGSKRMLVLR